MSRQGSRQTLFDLWAVVHFPDLDGLLMKDVAKLIRMGDNVSLFLIGIISKDAKLAAEGVVCEAPPLVTHLREITISEDCL